MNAEKRDGKIYVTDALGFDYDDGRLVLTPRQAYDLMVALEDVEMEWRTNSLFSEGDGEDG